MENYMKELIGGVIRSSDKAHIPQDESNKDYQAYLMWCDENQTEALEFDLESYNSGNW